MPEPTETSPLPSAPAPKASVRPAPRRKKADQRLRILERLTHGLTVAHIARVEELTVRRVRQIVAEMVDSRDVDPPAGFVQLQIARLGEAMIVARTMMMEGDLKAMDRLIKLTGELDRYHGFPPAQLAAGPESPPPRLAASPGRALLPSPRRDEGGKFCGSEALEIPQNAIGISKLPEPAPAPSPDGEAAYSAASATGE